ncbi:hypothetical protein BMAJHU_B0733 [Burkholderia mallei JHU]|nr:hypothetical protein BMAJHU_B0733 [Burkholderia mallei JHU]
MPPRLRPRRPPAARRLPAGCPTPGRARRRAPSSAAPEHAPAASSAGGRTARCRVRAAKSARARKGKGPRAGGPSLAMRA